MSGSKADSMERLNARSGGSGLAKKTEKSEPPPAGRTMNMMHDRRIYRGNTFSKHNKDKALKRNPILNRSNQEQDLIRRSGRQSSTDRIRNEVLKSRTLFPQEGIPSPPPVEGRKHLTMQTDTYIEKLSDKADTESKATQFDPSTDRPSTPLFRPKKRGIDRSTQLSEGEIFDFDKNVAPILDVLVRKTLERSFMEVMQEEELEIVRRKGNEYMQMKNGEITEITALKEKQQRRADEKDRRKAQIEEQQILAQKQLQEKLARAAISSKTYVQKQQDVFGRHDARKEDISNIRIEVDKYFLPWLMGTLEQNLNRICLANGLTDDLIRTALNGVLSARAQDKESHEHIGDAPVQNLEVPVELSGMASQGQVDDQNPTQWDKEISAAN